MFQVNVLISTCGGNMELPKRKQMRLHGYDYSISGAYFITICVKDRHKYCGMV